MQKAIRLTLFVSALGYFVDTFDMALFPILRVSSLRDLGYVSPEQLSGAGVWLFNLQSAGFLIGGFLWGILGDRKGRRSILLGSILLYSISTIANGLVTNLNSYGLCRLFSGIGLAGELGAAISLTSELMNQKTRGYGTALISTLGMIGIITASLVGQLVPWRMSYFIGGGLGLLLLALRIPLTESSLFLKMDKTARRGDLRVLLQGGSWARYLGVIIAGMPILFALRSVSPGDIGQFY